MGYGENNKGPYTLATFIQDGARTRFGNAHSPEDRLRSFDNFLQAYIEVIRAPSPGQAGIGNGADIIDFHSLEMAYTELFKNEDLGVGPNLKQEASSFWKELDRMKNKLTGTVTPWQIETAWKAQRRS